MFIQTGHEKSNSAAIQAAQLISSFHAASELIIAMSAADACSGLSWLSSPFHMWEAEGWESTPLAFSVSIWKGREVPEQRQTTKLTFLPTEIPIFLWLHLNWHKVMWGKKEKGSQKSIKAANVTYSQSIYSLKPGGITGILGWEGWVGVKVLMEPRCFKQHTHTLTKWQQHQFLCNQNPGMKTLVSETGRVCSLARSLTDQ